MSASPLPDQLRARILSAVQREPSPPRAVVVRSNALMLATAVALQLGVFLAFGGIRAAPRPPELIVQTSAGAALIAGGALWFAARRGGSMLGRPRAWLGAFAFAAPALLLGWKIACSAEVPGMMQQWVERPGFRCLRLSLLSSAGLLLALLLARRGTDPVHPRLSGAALGVATGACAWLVVDLWCPVAYVPHLLIGHVLPVAVLALFGAWIGGRLLALRSA